jgi:hypothetical protein
VNDGLHGLEGDRTNAEITMHGDFKDYRKKYGMIPYWFLSLTATKPIKKGEEILISYGNDYWNNYTIDQMNN